MLFDLEIDNNQKQIKVDLRNGDALFLPQEATVGEFFEQHFDKRRPATWRQHGLLFWTSGNDVFISLNAHTKCVLCTINI